MRRVGSARHRRWVLPPRAPEAWLVPAWPAALGAGLLACLLVPLLLLPGETLLAPRALPVAAVLGAAAALLGAYGLLVGALVTVDRRLRWVAAGFAAAAAGWAGRSAALAGGDTSAPQAAALGTHLAVPLLVLALPLAARDLRLVLVPLALLAAAVGATWAAGPEVAALDVVPVVVGLLAALRWWQERRRDEPLPHALVLAALVGGAAAAATRLSVDGEASPGALVVEGLGLGLPGLVLGLVAATHHRQVRRWRHLELAARRLRSSTSLMPGRSIAPDDVSALPDEVAVRRLLSGTVGLALQPVLDLTTGQVVGQEALARFGGREPTDRWFRAAAAAGLGGHLELLTLTTALACRQDLPPGQFLALNASPYALEDPQVRELLLAHDLTGVLVEITEHDAISDYDRLRARLEQLRQRGARIAVDDAGAGHASLRHVLLLQPDVVKLDVALTRGAGEPRQAALVAALVALARDVGVDVLAEGVELPEQVPVLLELGVGLAQGWHLGLPVTVVAPVAGA